MADRGAIFWGNLGFSTASTAVQGGGASPEIQKVEPIASVTVVGSIKLNNRNATTEEITKVYIKGKTSVNPTTLSGNRFRLEGVNIPANKIIEIEVEIKGVSSPHSAFFTAPPAINNVVDLGEVLIEVKPSRVKTGNGKSNAPQITIINTNVQNN
ncbi:MAG: hypothetical protein PHU06_09150 [Gallionella sp.]|nr:hypothetical protein [Gallionella sp.]MDD4960355.1 hypothetical protein [Gallionella sp.]